MIANPQIFKTKTGLIPFFILLIFLVIFTSCNSENNKSKAIPANKEKHLNDIDSTETQTDFSKTNSVVSPISESMKLKFKTIMGKGDADSLITYLNAYQFVTTAEAFEKQWRKGEKLLARIAEHLNSKYGDGYTAMEKMSILDKCFGLRASCDAECTVFIFSFDVSDLKDLAKETTGSADDSFLGLMESIQGETIYYQKSWINTFARTWDYGGGSLLGDSSCYNFLVNSYHYLHQKHAFISDITANRKHVLEDMSHTIYMYSREKVLAEINRLLSAKVLNKIEQQEVLKIQKRIQNNLPDLQFGCESPTADCDFGG